jgi:hypothetical protein
VKKGRSKCPHNRQRIVWKDTPGRESANTTVEDDDETNAAGQASVSMTT